MDGLDQAFIALSNAFLELIAAIALADLSFYLLANTAINIPVPMIE
ncbi:MAG: hypothetical protein ACYCSH_03555 [Acidithiobacillus sp.]